MKTMIKTTTTLLIVGALSTPVQAKATASDEHAAAIGLGTGALLGTLVAGPVGGVVGGLFGAMIGNDKTQEAELLAAQTQLASTEDQLFAMRDALHSMQEQAKVTRVAYREAPEERVMAVQSSIQFKTASVEVEKGYHQQLDLIAEALTRHDQLQVRLTGHADNRGDEKFNEALSMQRALNVKRYLINQGVAPEQVLTVAVGEQNSDGQSYEETFFDRKVVMEIAGTGKTLTAKR